MKPSTLQSFISFGDLRYEEAITRPQYVARVPGTILAISGHNELRQSITSIPFSFLPRRVSQGYKKIRTRSKFRCQSPYCAGEAWDGQHGHRSQLSVKAVRVSRRVHARSRQLQARYC